MTIRRHQGFVARGTFTLTANVSSSSNLVVRSLVGLVGGVVLLSSFVAWSRASTSPLPVHVLCSRASFCDLVHQVGGAHVEVRTVDVSSPPTTSDTPASVVTEDVQWADVVVQNGAGLDGVLPSLETSSSSHALSVITADQLVDPVSPGTQLWWSPGAMQALVTRVTTVLDTLRPASARSFQASALRVTASLGGIDDSLAVFRRRYPGALITSVTPVASTLVSLTGEVNDAPATLTSPTAWSEENSIIDASKVRALLFDPTAPASVDGPLLLRAAAAQVPVVAIYPSIPVGYSYETWIEAEIAAIVRAITTGISTPQL